AHPHELLLELRIGLEVPRHTQFPSCIQQDHTVITGFGYGASRAPRGADEGVTRMRAWQVQGKGEPQEVLHHVEVPEPEPGPGQVQIRVTASGVGLPDVLMCRGTYPLTPPVPFTPGQE